MRAVDATVTLPVAFATMLPPVVPGASPVAETCPSMMIEPPTPFSAMRPVLLPTLAALIVPPASTRFVTMPSTARAVSCTVPPSARITPVLVTSAVRAVRRVRHRRR